MTFEPITVRIGPQPPHPSLALYVRGYEHPDTAEPPGLDLLACEVAAIAGRVNATYDLAIRQHELLDLAAYLRTIHSGNGPSQSFTFASGLLALSFAPSRRGPVLCAVALKTIDAAHVRLEYMITLEPETIGAALHDFARLEAL